MEVFMIVKFIFILAPLDNLQVFNFHISLFFLSLAKLAEISAILLNHLKSTIITASSSFSFIKLQKCHSLFINQSKFKLKGAIVYHCLPFLIHKAIFKFRVIIILISLIIILLH